MSEHEGKERRLLQVLLSMSGDRPSDADDTDREDLVAGLKEDYIDEIMMMVWAAFDHDHKVLAFQASLDCLALSDKKTVFDDSPEPEEISGRTFTDWLNSIH